MHGPAMSPMPFLGSGERAGVWYLPHVSNPQGQLVPVMFGTWMGVPLPKLQPNTQVRLFEDPSTKAAVWEVFTADKKRVDIIQTDNDDLETIFAQIAMVAG